MQLTVRRIRFLLKGRKDQNNHQSSMSNHRAFLHYYPRRGTSKAQCCLWQLQNRGKTFCPGSRIHAWLMTLKLGATMVFCGEVNQIIRCTASIGMGTAGRRRGRSVFHSLDKWDQALVDAPDCMIIRLVFVSGHRGKTDIELFTGSHMLVTVTCNGNVSICFSNHNDDNHCNCRFHLAVINVYNEVCIHTCT